MKDNHLLNIWLRFVLRQMKERKGFVCQSSAEGHIRKSCFSTCVEDPAENIHSAEHLARMFLLWARDSVLNDDGNFAEGMNKITTFSLVFMEDHWKDFCDAYKPEDSKRHE